MLRWRSVESRRQKSQFMSSGVIYETKKKDREKNSQYQFVSEDRLVFHLCKKSRNQTMLGVQSPELSTHSHRNRRNSDRCTFQPLPALTALILPRRMSLRYVALEILRYLMASWVVSTPLLSITNTVLSPLVRTFLEKPT